jgi:O-antigen/teichoic acid export membrane protein
MMVLQAILSLYFANLYPGLSRAAVGEPARLRRLLLQSVALAGVGALLLALAAAVKAEPLLWLIYRGNELCNATSAECLRWLVLVLPLLALRGHARMTLLAFGRGRLELLASLAGTAALALLIPWWTVRCGVAGAAQALLAAEALGLVLTVGALAVAWRRRVNGRDGNAAAAAPPGGS